MKYAVMTGARSLMAKEVIASLQNDFFLFLIDANPALVEDYLAHPNVHVMIYDLTKHENFPLIQQEITTITSTVDLVIHFAGIVELGSLVEVDVATFEKVMQINLFAVYQLNQTLFPLLLAASGRIIHVSSEYGLLLGLPFHSFYTMSKHALEVYNDSLRRELAPLGIKVIKILPGAFKTQMQANVTKQFDRLLASTQHFHTPLTTMQKMMLGELKNAKHPRHIVKTFKKAIQKKHPKIAYHVHHSFKMKLLNILPARLQDYLLSKFF